MPMYVYQVKVELSDTDTLHFPALYTFWSKQTILYKCERKARKFVAQAISLLKEDVTYDVWTHGDNQWIIDKLASSQRCTISIKEVRVQT